MAREIPIEISLDSRDNALAEPLADMVSDYLSSRAKEDWTIALDGKTWHFSGEYDDAD